MGISLDRLNFDYTAVTDGPLVGASIVAENTSITKTTDGAKERLDVSADIIVSTPSELALYDEDSAHTTADRGQFIMAVRNDTQGTLVDTDGDYAPLQVDNVGRLRVVSDLDLTGDLVADGEVDSEDPLKVGSHAYDQGSALTAVDAGDKANLASDLYRRIFVNTAPSIALAQSAVSVDTTAGGTQLDATPLAGRTRIIIQNNGSANVYLGASGVTSATGTVLTKSNSLTMELGEAVPIYAIAASGTQDVRILQVA